MNRRTEEFKAQMVHRLQEMDIDNKLNKDNEFFKYIMGEANYKPQKAVKAIKKPIKKIPEHCINARQQKAITDTEDK